VKKYLWKIPVILAFTAVFLLTKTEMKEDFDFKSNNPVELVKAKIPEAASIEESNYINEWSLIFDAEGNMIGKFLLSSPFCDDIRGYGGNIPLAIIADNSDKIIGLGLFYNRETPAWIDGLQNIKFFDSWNGKTLDEIKDLQVDAVTGATFTTVAVRDILKKRTGIFTGMLKYEKAEKKISLKWIEDKFSPVLYFILLASLIALFIKKLNRFRIYFQLASIIFFGIISGKFISIYFLESISINGLSIFTSFVTVFLVVSSILIPLIFNKHFYCYYICPFGGVQTLLGKIPVKKVQINADTVRLLRAVRLMIFITLLISIVSVFKIDLTLVEPFTIFIFSSATVITIIGSALIFAASIFIKNPWCVYFCPTGQFFDLLKDGLKKS
jgi:hypothetical protein